MTEDAKRFLNLKEDAQALREIEWTDCAMNPRVCTTMMHKAADLIESMSAELERVKRERDAAVKDLKDFCSCHHCWHYKRDCNDKCYFVTGLKPDWQWRGVMSDE